jgi:hypothetical protein
MQELVDKGKLSPSWRARQVPSEAGSIRADVYPDQKTAVDAATTQNQGFSDALAAREMDATLKRSLQLKVSKAIQCKERLQKEEALMLAEARRRYAHLPHLDPASIILPPSSECHRRELAEQLSEMPYLTIVMVASPQAYWRKKILFKLPEGGWSEPHRGEEPFATTAERAKIADGFGLSAEGHWGKTKAEIQDILLPRANQLLKLTQVQDILAKALKEGKKAVILNGFVFWYEEDGNIGWKVKQISSTRDSERGTLWIEGTIKSTNHGRLVVLPYIKANGKHVDGYTKNGPNGGPALPRRPDQHLNIPFIELDGDLVIGLFGELPYEKPSKLKRR